MFVKPWNKDIENILRRLMHDKVAYTKNTYLASDLGRHFPELIDEDFIDVVTTNYRKKPKESIFIMKPGVVSIPKRNGFFFHKIF